MGLTPMMMQYLDMHNKVKDSILFFRLGDFYEMFFDDAVLVSKELELTLTSKNCGLEERAPMCGVPFHSADNYIAKLVEKGYKVAICDQIEDPATAKGLVERDIIRIISPGTLTDSEHLNPDTNNFLMSLYGDKKNIGCAYIDLSTGEFFVTEYSGEEPLEFLFNQLSRYSPSEIIIQSHFYENKELLSELKNRFSFYSQPYPAKNFEYKSSSKRICEQFNVYNVEALGLGGKESAVRAAGGILSYVDETQKRALDHIHRIRYAQTDSVMTLDSASIRNLELVRTIRTGSKKGSLLGILDKTVTAAGSRLMIKTIEAPLLNKEKIINRHDRVEELYNDEEILLEIGNELSEISDLERICTKISFNTIVPADLIALKNSISAFKKLVKTIEKSSLEYIKSDFNGVDLLTDVYELLERSIEEDKESNHFGIPYKIKKGFDKNLDTYRLATENGSKWLKRLEEQERELTKINNLKIKSNKVFGYFIEVSNSKKHLVPDRYIRKQTLTNSERYFTPELKKLEEKINEAEEEMDKLENELYSAIIAQVQTEIRRIQKVARLCSILDVYRSFAIVAKENSYVRPEICEDGTIEIEKGRHPVVEQFTGASYFISNELNLNEDERLMLITGPNMAGKSTYIRQNALIVLMAQIGSFVPAQSARISIVDRIFTRVGASDDLSTGQSTFMVEMTEVSNILKNATDRSLVILDEIGRGTSTFDGVSIAWAICENLLERNIMTLFATHYHELTELETDENRLVNYCIEVHESEQGVVFSRKIKKGSTDQSYGVEVAKLAGFPDQVIDRANFILAQLEKENINPNVSNIDSNPVSLTENKEDTEEDDYSPLISFLDTINPDNLTPRESQNVLYDLIEIYHENKNA